MATKNLHGAQGRGDLLMFRPEDLCIHEDPAHPQYDPRIELPVSEAMVASIIELGIIEPLVISRDGEDVYVVDGRQRRAASIEANKRLKREGRPLIQVPCVWRRGDDARLFEVALAANEIRRGDSPLERAKKMQRLAELGRSIEQVAVVFGCSPATAKASLALLDCDKAVQAAVESGKVAATTATKLHKLPREEQRAALSKMLESGATKGQRAKDEVSKARGEKAGPRLRSRTAIEARLKQHMEEGDSVCVEVLLWVLGQDELPEASAAP